MRFESLKVAALILLSILLLSAIFQYFNHTYIKAEFEKTDPMPPKMPVYYKGYKIGTTRGLKISKDFSKTFLFITLNQRGLHFPKNISVQVKNYDDETKYVDIIYPNAPKIKYIKTGDIIKGESILGSDGISDTNQAHLDDLSAKGENLLTSAAKTTDTLTDLFELIFEILDENRENIHSSTTSLKRSMANLETTSENLKTLTLKINNQISDDTIKNTTSNIEVTTQNLAKSSKGFISVTDNFSKTSSDFNILVPKLSVLIDIAQMLTCNINDIVLGVKNTLKQKMGGARIIFGKTIKE